MVPFNTDWLRRRNDQWLARTCSRQTANPGAPPKSTRRTGVYWWNPEATLENLQMPRRVLNITIERNPGSPLSSPTTSRRGSRRWSTGTTTTASRNALAIKTPARHNTEWVSRLETHSAHCIERQRARLTSQWYLVWLAIEWGPNLNNKVIGE